VTNFFEGDEKFCRRVRRKFCPRKLARLFLLDKSDEICKGEWQFCPTLFCPIKYPRCISFRYYKHNSIFI